MINVLFTSSGRRGYLLGYFKQALNTRGGGTVHAANSTRNAVSFASADKHVIVPDIHAAGYVDTLIAYCTEHAISMVLPLFDIDLPVLAAAKERFAMHGIRVVVADPERLAICNDKWAMFEKLSEAGIGVPHTYLGVERAVASEQAGNKVFPAIMKPRWGMGSIGILPCANAEQAINNAHSLEREIADSYLRFESSATPGKAIVLQQRVEGPEYGLDIINDLQGRHILTNAKRKIAMRSGETDAATTVDMPALEELGAQLAALIQQPGNLDVDVIEQGGVYHVLDMNARFGGGYPFSHLAGCRLPEAILRWHNGEAVDPALLRARTGVTGMKDIHMVEATW